MTGRPITAAAAASLLLLVLSTHAGEARADEKTVCAAKYQSAQRLRAAGKLTLARADLLRCAEPTCPAFVNSDCKAWLAEVDAELPTLVFAVLDTRGADVPSAQLRLDGALVPGAVDGLGHAVDPGEHLVEASAGSLAFRQRIVVRVGERARRIELRPEADSLGPAARRAPVGAYVLSGLGFAAIATGSILWLAGSNAAKGYNADCESAGCSASQHDAIERQLVAGDVAWGVGIAAGIAATALFIFAPSAQAAPTIALGPSGIRVSGVF